MKSKKTIQQMSWTELHNSAFISEGRMVAFPLGFPGGSIPITADESHITALDVAPSGDIYGGTSGYAAHVFAGYFHYATGAVLDFGAIPDSNHCPAVCCGDKRLIALVNGPQGGRILGHSLQSAPGIDLLQEWGFHRDEYTEIGAIGDREHLVHAVADLNRQNAVGISNQSLFTVNIDQQTIEEIGAVEGQSQVGQGSEGHFFGLDNNATLWRFDLLMRKIERHAISLPAGKWNDVFLRWARDNRDGTLYTADGDGQLFAFREEEGFQGPLGQTPLAPITSMSVTHDGRLFGTCGSEMEHFFVYHPQQREIRDLGIAVSTLERRRYGYQFGDAVTGQDGEMYFGEADDLGHLWMYFPKIVG